MLGFVPHPNLRAIFIIKDELKDMKYLESQKDESIRKRFKNDYSNAFLRSIKLEKGQIRGINNLNLKFYYPITAIAGKNGAGKSTILALSCCAFHNKKNGYKQSKRKLCYYTFSDFFIQHKEEVPPQGISIKYEVAYDKWKKTETFPEGKGVGVQRRVKKTGGKWNDYATRVHRNVVFIGIERVVPHTERSQSRSYSKTFKEAKSKGWEDKVKEIVGFILGKKYDNFKYVEHSKYSLPVAQTGDLIHSGFNMGAGESALFEIFSTIYSCGKGALIVIDEIELGLHVEAQKKFIDKLKDVCLEIQTQVICTTHSKEILECLPYDARFFVECINNKTQITPGISSEFAFSKLASIPSKELEIYVEDKVAEKLLQASLPHQVRSRLTLKKIGSATALVKQLAALYLNGDRSPFLIVFDGDQRINENNHLNFAKKMAEKVCENFDHWFKDHIAYLPGEDWPEMWVVRNSYECMEDICKQLNCSFDDLKVSLDSALTAGKHNEFHDLAKNLCIDESQCIYSFTNCICSNFPNEFTEIIGKINEKLIKSS